MNQTAEGWRCELDSCDLEQEPLADFSVHSYESLGSAKCWRFFNWMRINFLWRSLLHEFR